MYSEVKRSTRQSVYLLALSDLEGKKKQLQKPNRKNKYLF